MAYIYLIRAENNRYKIGISVNVHRRFTDLDHFIPLKIELVHTIKCDKSFSAETELHNQFKEKNYKYEWFNLSDSDVDYITSLIIYKNGRFYTLEELPSLELIENILKETKEIKRLMSKKALPYIQTAIEVLEEAAEIMRDMEDE